MPNIFHFLADSLLDRNNEFITLNNFGPKRWFGLKYRGYDGLMAQPRPGTTYVEREKEGCFDVFICTGERYLDRNNYKQVTHYNLFNDLLEHSSLEHCYQLWRGSMPSEITESVQEQQGLSALALLMFEQELNWGNECWQRYSNFPPCITQPYSRPRDMIMGFLKIAFQLGNLDNYPYWNTKIVKGTPINTTPTFGTGYATLQPQYRISFEELQNDDTAEPLMTGEYLQRFRNAATAFSNNPFYK